MAVLRRFRVAARIIALAVAALIAVLLIATVSITSARGAAAAQARAAAAQAAQEAALTATFHLTDLHGWQTAYAFDVSLRGSVGSRDGSPARSAFLDAADATRSGLDALETAAGGIVTEAELEPLAGARASIEEFLALDEQVVALYRTDDPIQRQDADRLVLRQGTELFRSAVSQLREFSDLMQDRVDASTAAAQAAADRTARVVLLVTLGILVVATPGVFALSRSIRIPLRQLRLRLEDIAHGDGDLTARLDEDGQDDLADIARLFNTFVADVAGTVRDVTESASTLGAAADELSATTEVLAGAAQDTSSQAGTVAEASGRISTTVQGFSAGATQMQASIQEIARDAGRAADVTASAVRLADRARGTVHRLGTSSQEINGVVAMIEGIAAQTNLLALNATIEAARAGDAGRGFAVVAGEVKELAQATARATSDVSRRIEQIQGETEAAVDAIAEIAQVVDRVNDVAASIAGAVEEQTAVAAQMSRSFDEVADGSTAITASITGVATSAQASSAAVTDAREATAELVRMGTRLSDLVARFTV